MKKDPNLTPEITESAYVTTNCEEAVNAVAADFAAQYTDEDLFLILNKNPYELRNYLQEVAAENLRFAVSILPGRPSRPSRPTV